MQKLYGVPDSMPVAKGAEIPTKNGIVVIPEDTYLWSSGAMKAQVLRNLNP